jgi:hypothetical protein
MTGVAIALPPKVRERLERLIGMTGSDQDGEALTALRMAQKVATEHRTTLMEILLTPLRAQALDLTRLADLERDAYERGFASGQASVANQSPPATWPLLVERCLRDHPRLMNDWEREFMSSFLERGWAKPTAKQLPIMERIAGKCGIPVPK